MIRKFWLILLIFLAKLSVYADPNPTNKTQTQEQWVDSVFNTLTEDEKLGQLFMVAAYSDKGQDHIAELENIIRQYHVGGLVFIKGNLRTQVNLTNHYQSVSKVPLLIAMNAESGLSISKDSSITFPKQLTLGAIKDEKAIYEMGNHLAKQLKRLGVSMNFAPAIDVNTAEALYKLNDRSFGEDIKNVYSKSSSYIKGLKDGRVIANAQLFPSYDPAVGANYTLPVVSQSSERLKSVEMFPLQQLVKDSLMSILVGHTSLASIDASHKRSSNFSSEVIKNTLRKDYGFEGLIFTDALNVKQINETFKPGEVDLQALLAGNDVLIFSENIPKAIKKIKSALKSKDLKQGEIDKSIKKILRAKYWAGISRFNSIDINKVSEDLNKSGDLLINYNLYGKAITIIDNKNNLLPFRAIDTLTFASVSIGAEANNEFQSMLSNYAGFTNYTINNKYAQDSVFNNLIKKLSKYKVVIVGFHGMSNTEGNSYGLSPNSISFFEKLKQQTRVIPVVFGNPLAFKVLGTNNQSVCAYEDNRFTRELAPQILFGAIEAQGILPITIGTNYKVGYGITTKSLGRLKYGIPESAGLDAEVLKNIDLVAAQAIKNGSTPGCQVLVARKGTVVFQKAYGFITYDSIQPVTNQTIYDIASITKVVATVQVLMFLEERGLLDLDKKLVDYLPELKASNKGNLVIRDILIHQAGLTPFIPHWTKTVSYNGYDPRYYSDKKSDKYTLEVANGMYGLNSLPDSIYKWTVASNLQKKGKRQIHFEYKYSDVGYLFMKKISEKLLNQPMEDFLFQNFYQPLGASTLGYLPLHRYPEERIAPTEDDKSFRRQLIRGSVHDQGAAMLGGVAGHAGLFSTANDVAKILQMDLNKGYYGGQRFLKEETVPKFASRQKAGNRRGLGWDKPALAYDEQTSAHASPNSFGHTGFTGTAAWVDPDKEIVYIFLSNRIYPNAANNNLLKEGTRSRIQDEIYKAMISFDTKNNLQ
jgi:beta-N-acetylhexosaminidase